MLRKMKIKHTILLVEDNPAHVLITKEAFEEVKREEDDFIIEIVNVRDGIEALQYLSIHKTLEDLPDLILIDINLPLLNGLDFLKKIKSHKNFKQIPAIIITNGSRKGEITKAYECSANAFIIKPFKYNHFLKMIQLLKRFWFDFAILPTKIINKIPKKQMVE